jgi:cytochrome c556
MGRSVLLAVMAASALAIGVMANEKPTDAYVKSMKETNAASQSLKKNVAAKNYEGIATDAATLKTLFTGTEEFWTARKTDDAIAAAKEGVSAATDLETAAKAKNEAGVETAAKAVNATCKTCHDAHRERLPDGTSEIK